MEKEEVDGGGGHHHQVEEEEDLVVIEADLNDIQNSDYDVFALVAARVSITLVNQLRCFGWIRGIISSELFPNKIHPPPMYMYTNPFKS